MAQPDDATRRGPFLRLLGPPTLRWGGAEAPLGQALPQRLLAYLAVGAGWVGREQLGELLWPEAEASRRLTNLRRLLGRVKELPWADGVEHGHAGRLRWTVASDLAAFLDPRQGLAERLRLWRGPLLEGVRADEETPFGRWLSSERHRTAAVWRTLVLQRVASVVGGPSGTAARDAGSQGADGGPVTIAEATALLGALLRSDPLDEEAVQQLLHLASEGGDRPRALAAYRRFEQRLRRDLGLDPLALTLRLAQRLEQAPAPDAAGAAQDRVAAEVASGAPDDPLAGLGDAARRVLEAASLAQEPFSLAQVAPATVLVEWLALDGLERAVQAGLLRREADGRYGFADPGIRRTLLDAMTAEQRQLIRRRLAWAAADGQGASLAWHRRMADEALQLRMPAAALQHLARAAELSVDEAERVELALRIADLSDDTVDHHGREQALGTAAAAAERLGDPQRVLRVALARANHEVERGRTAEAAAQVREVMAIGVGGDDLARLRLTTARLHLATGDLGAAEADACEALATLPDAATALRGALRMVHFKALGLQGRLEEAAAPLEAAMQDFEAVDRRDSLAEATCMRGMLLMLLGDRPAAARTLAHGLDLARGMGLVHVQRSAILNLLKLHTDVADVAMAGPLIEEGLALAHDFETAGAETAFLLAVGYVRYLQGELGSAWRAWQQAMQVADGTDDLGARLDARSAPFYPYLRAGELTRCRQLLEAMEDLVGSQGWSRMDGKLAVYRARLQVEEGHPERALQTLAGCPGRAELPPEERSEFALAEALAQRALGEPEAALRSLDACREAPTFEVALQAMALRLETLRRLGRPVAEAAAEAQARLAEGRLTPFEAVDLANALAAAKEAAGDRAGAAALWAEATSRLRRLHLSLAAAAEERPGRMAALR